MLSGVLIELEDGIRQVLDRDHLVSCVVSGRKVRLNLGEIMIEISSSIGKIIKPCPKRVVGTISCSLDL